MPELPEVETTRRGLATAMAGRIVRKLELRRSDLRFPFQQDLRSRIEGMTIERIDRRAKYLVFRVSSGDVLVAHLGMSGSFRVERGAAGKTLASLARKIPRRDAHDHVVFTMSDGARVIYNDPRRFGFMFATSGRELDRHPRLKDIGVEPLDPPLTPAALRRALSGSAAPLKAALLDQKRIAGLGNIYVCEALHRAGLSPWASARIVLGADRASTAAASRLSAAIRKVLSDAIAAGGSTLRDFSGADGKPGYFQHSFRVYDREGAGCPRADCRGSILRAVQAGRATYYCPDCQR